MVREEVPATWEGGGVRAGRERGEGINEDDLRMTVLRVLVLVAQDGRGVGRVLSGVPSSSIVLLLGSLRDTLLLPDVCGIVAVTQRFTKYLRKRNCFFKELCSLNNWL